MRHRHPQGDAGHDKLTIYGRFADPYQDRDQVAAALGLKNEEVRIRGTLIGGGFGGKEDIAGQIQRRDAGPGHRPPGEECSTRARSRWSSIPSATPRLLRSRPGRSGNGKLTAVQAELYGDGGHTPA